MDPSGRLITSTGRPRLVCFFIEPSADKGLNRLNPVAIISCELFASIQRHAQRCHVCAEFECRLCVFICLCMLTILGAGQARPSKYGKPECWPCTGARLSSSRGTSAVTTGSIPALRISVSMHRAYQNDFLQHAFYPGKVLYKKSRDI